jgi:CheY-like chemotaxis protein
MLTVHNSEAAKVEALDAGADDFVTKPFSTPELFRFSWKLSEGLKPIGGLADRSIWSETLEQGTPTLDFSRED